MFLPSHTARSASSSAVINLNGRVDFSRYREFKALCAPVLSDAAVSNLVIDLHRVAYIDSSALGMMLLLRDQAKAAGKSVELHVASGVVADVLKIARFDNPFEAFVPA
jgi:anti-anti-sigma factor